MRRGLQQYAPALLLTFGLIALPCASAAQVLGTVAGTVKDPSGAVLPGVTVEAASTVLIEKVRTAVTDGAGQYSIINLPPGEYTVTFTVSGFNTVRREGIEVSAGFTANVSVEMRVGELSETITVTGESPTVDIRSAAQAKAFTFENMKVLPSSGSWIGMALSVPAIQSATRDVGGVLGDTVGAQVTAHGQLPGDGVSMLDGLRIGNMYISSNVTNMALSQLLFDQVDIQISGQSGESGTNGVLMNIIPRTGGNTFRGSALVNGSAPDLQSSNLTQRLKDRGLTTASTTLKKLYDLNGAFGGPIKQDKLWFYYTSRYLTNEYYLADRYYPVNITDVVRRNDTSRQAYAGTWTVDNNIRLTWGLTPKQKISGWYAYQRKEDPWWQIAPFLRSPEASPVTSWRTQLSTFTWTYTATNRLLFELGVAPGASPDTILARPDQYGGIPIVEQGGVVAAPLTYRAPTSLENRDNLPSQSFKANTSYVTGSHSVKFGMDMQRGHFERNDSNNMSEGLEYRVRDYIPNQLTLKSPLAGYTSRLNYNLGIYAQDRWTTGRLTVNGGIRVDFQNESADAFVATPDKWTPNRNVSHEEVKSIPNWKDFNPRISTVYDLFGNGRTAVKASASRGVEQDSIRYALANHPATTFVTSVNRVWIDSNNNFVPECDLLNPAINGECQGWSDLNFGTTRQSTFYDPAILDGWGVRPWNWEFSAGVQHEIVPRLSASFGYFRRIGGNFNVLDNELVGPSDYTEYSVAIPNDSRLPNPGGTLTGVYDLNPNRVGFVRNVVKDAANFGKQLAHWDGFDITIDARLRNSLTLAGGVSSGNQMTDNCEIVGQVPEILATAGGPAGVATPVAAGAAAGWTPKQYCHQESGFLAQYKGSASYQLPWAIRIGGVFQSIPGPQIAANNTYVGTVPSLGRPFSGGVATVNLIEPGTMYGDRLYQLDLRFTKIFNLGTGRLETSLDLYNALNSDAILAQQNTYGTAWARPTNVIQPRFLKLAARWDF
jgi:hypothetical protein